MPEPLICLENVTKVYPMGPRSYTALRGVDLDIDAGEFVALVGPSGSGKSTILNMITGIDKPTSGTVTVNGVRVDRMGENELARWRGQNIGIVFQFFQLLPTLTALENVILPMDLRGSHPPWSPLGGGRHRRERALEHLRLVGLEDHAGHLPSELSGGEQQRVAIARALANDPPILIADEPTGNLDTATGERIIDILTELHRRGKTVVMVTHEPYIALLAERVLHVQDGRIAEGGS